uniref:Anti-proliferative protein domain-containing protein n=1 Tax=Ditylenchus dipsaci TaxID=166011 RepID=A0A915EUJ5_9BILA
MDYKEAKNVYGIERALEFVARYLQFRVPRLKICQFVEHMSNLLLLRYQGKWDVTDPKKFANERMLRFGVGIPPEDLVLSAASAVGLSVEDIISCLPGRMVIMVNPGEVYYIDDNAAAPKPIWLGLAETADEKFVQGSNAQLSLVHPRELGLENPFPNNLREFMMFRYVVPGSQNFSVESFAQTRFGSLRKRPDPEILRRLQKSIIAATAQSDL